MSDPDMGSWSYAYDAAGNLIQQTDARGQTISFAYDELNRLVRKYYPAVWVDDTLTNSHSPGVYDLMELRSAIDIDRVAASQGLGPFIWSN